MDHVLPYGQVCNKVVVAAVKLCSYVCTESKYDYLLAFAYQGKKDIVVRFIIEYSSLRDFGP
jgi:hypothetical protein